MGGQKMRPIAPALKNIDVYESRYSLFVTGFDVQRCAYQVLEVPRPAQGSVPQLPPLNLVYDENVVYTRFELDEYLRSRKVSKSNRIVSEGFLLYGFVGLLESHYMIVVTRAETVAMLHGHRIYSVCDTLAIPITYKPRKTMEESRYKAMLASIDFSAGHYFSYTYDLSSSLQRNHNHGDGLSSGLLMHPQDIFVWNLHPLQPLLALRGSSEEPRSNSWVVPVVFGFLEQRTVRLEDGHLLHYTLVARRSQRFAGTRYLRRGVDNSGFVANEVETEQIVTVESGIFNLSRSCSLVQVRGSIPLYWCHTNVIAPSPGISIEKTDPALVATRLHFAHLVSRYGAHVAVLNLVRQKDGGREVKLGRAFGACCAAMNPELNLSETEENGALKLSLGALPMLALRQLVTALGTVSLVGGNNAGSNEGKPTDGDTTSDEEDEEVKPSVDTNPGTASDGDGNSTQLPGLPITYVGFDLLASHDEHSNGPTVFDTIADIARAVFPQTGFFVQPPFGNRSRIRGSNEADKDVDTGKKAFTKFPIGADEDGWDLGLLAIEPHALRNPEPPPSHPPPQTQMQTTPTKMLNENALSWSAMRERADGDREIEVAMELRPFGAAAAGVSKEEREADTDPESEGSVSARCRDDAPSPVETRVLEGQNEERPQAPDELLDSEPDSSTAEKLSDARRSHTVGPGLPIGLLQRGLLRTNCIDCLDRTNIGQFTYAKAVLPAQLRALGVHLSSQGLGDVLLVAMEAWARHGDEISKQYGGSGAMHRVDVKTGSGGGVWGGGDAGIGASTVAAGEAAKPTEFAMTGGIQNGVVAVNRYYSNITADAEKQQAFDLLLGVFVPRRGAPASWELDLGPGSQRGPESGPSETVSSPNAAPPPLPLVLRCSGRTVSPFFSDEHLERLALTSFRRLDRGAGGSHTNPCLEGVSVEPPPWAFRPHTKQQTCPDNNGLLEVEEGDGSSSGYCTRPLLPVNVAGLGSLVALELYEYAETGLPLGGDCDAFSRGFYQDYLQNGELDPLPTAAQSQVASGKRRQSVNREGAELKKQLQEWRRLKQDPLGSGPGEAVLGEGAPGSSSNTPRTSVNVNCVSYCERLGVMPGPPLDSVNEAWLATGDKMQEHGVSSFPAFGVRKGRRSSRPSVDDESVPSEGGIASAASSLLGLPGLVAGAGAEFLPSSDSFTSLNPFAFLSSLGFFRAEKTITQ